MKWMFWERNPKGEGYFPLYSKVHFFKETEKRGRYKYGIPVCGTVPDHASGSGGLVEFDCIENVDRMFFIHTVYGDNTCKRCLKIWEVKYAKTLVD